MIVSTAEREDAPWGTRRLWSLWDMLDKHAFYFAIGAGSLTEFKYLCAELEKYPNQPLPENLRRVANWSIERLRQGYILSGMDEAMGPLNRLHASVNPAEGFPEPMAGVIGYEAKHLLSGLWDALESEFYFHLDQEDAPLYFSASLFGDRVSKKFPKAIEDIAEAGKCLSLQRPTACVFHLMRVMEIGVQAFGKKLKVGVNIQIETWYQIMEHVDGAIRQLPSKSEKEKRRKAELAAASANLNAVRIAWRNEVMHPKQTYTREEAHDLFGTTRSFMDHLSGLI